MRWQLAVLLWWFMSANHTTGVVVTHGPFPNLAVCRSMRDFALETGLRASSCWETAR